jgi:ribosome biogenesis protein ERB1
VAARNAGLSYIPAPKPQLPGHEESYNPPAEYVPTEEEVAAYEMMEPHERPKFVPKSFAAMRQVPAYDKFVHERFERCLDLYLCPRTRKKRVMMDPVRAAPAPSIRRVLLIGNGVNRKGP